MKRKKLKDGRVATCSFCKVLKTEFRIQGHPLGGRTVCEYCWHPIRTNELAEEANEREQSEGEYQIQRYLDKY